MTWSGTVQQTAPGAAAVVHDAGPVGGAVSAVGGHLLGGPVGSLFARRRDVAEATS
jgi:hypothetical protein